MQIGSILCYLYMLMGLYYALFLGSYLFCSRGGYTCSLFNQLTRLICSAHWELSVLLICYANGELFFSANGSLNLSKLGAERAKCKWIFPQTEAVSECSPAS